MKIESLDHLVLTVRNIEATCHFYSTVLGVDIVFFEEGRRALGLGDQKINLHEAGSERKPHALHPTVGSSDLCFIADTSLAAMMEHLQPFGVKIIEGPVERTGAMGKLRSIYFHDPDGNLVEVAEYIEKTDETTEKKKPAFGVPLPPPAKKSEGVEVKLNTVEKSVPLPPPPKMDPKLQGEAPIKESLLPLPPMLNK